MPRSRIPASNGRRARRTAAAAPDASADADLSALLRQTALHVRALFEKAGELASLGWKRMKLRAVDGAFHAVLLFAALAAGTTILVSASLLVVSGIRHAFGRWAGADWVGELGGGLLALSLPFVVLLLLRRSTRRALLERALHPAEKAPVAETANESASAAAPPAAAASES